MTRWNRIGNYSINNEEEYFKSHLTVFFSLLNSLISMWITIPYLKKLKHICTRALGIGSVHFIEIFKFWTDRCSFSWSGRKKPSNLQYFPTFKTNFSGRSGNYNDNHNCKQCFWLIICLSVVQIFPIIISLHFQNLHFFIRKIISNRPHN